MFTKRDKESLCFRRSEGAMASVSPFLSCLPGLPLCVRYETWCALNRENDRNGPVQAGHGRRGKRMVVPLTEDCNSRLSAIYALSGQDKTAGEELGSGQRTGCVRMT